MNNLNDHEDQHDANNPYFILGAILHNKNKFTAKLQIIKGYMSNSAALAPFYLDWWIIKRQRIKHLKRVNKEPEYVAFSLM